MVKINFKGGALASLRFRSGGWDLRYRERDGSERTERFRGGSERRPPESALDRKAKVEMELRRGRYVPREKREVRFADYYAPWAAARQISASRRYTDDQRAAKHVLPHWGDWSICDIRPSDIDDWVAQLARSMGPQSVRACYGLLRGPLRRAVKDRIIDDPCIDIALPKLPSLRKNFDDVLTAQEVDRLVAAIVDPDPRYAALKTNGRYEALVFMGAWLGPRWNEAIGLRVCDINPLRHFRQSRRQPERLHDFHGGDVQDGGFAHRPRTGLGHGQPSGASRGVSTARRTRRLRVHEQPRNQRAARNLLEGRPA